MLRLLALPLAETEAVSVCRADCVAAPDDPRAKVALGVALGEAGCTYEAAAILRPLRAEWKATPYADAAKATLEVQAWWNKNWREFAQFNRAGERDAALALLGDRAVRFWDHPPLLQHLTDIALAEGRQELAEHLCRRVHDLAQRDLPKMNMAAFAYASEATLVEVMLARGKAAEALARHREITPNPGNAMAHEMQHVTLLAANGMLDEAMRAAASMLVTAEKHRTGYSGEMRRDFIGRAPELAVLRARGDWGAMIGDPAAYLRGVAQPT